MGTEVGEKMGWRKGLVISEVEGKLVKVWPEEEQPGEHGSYTRQNCELLIPGVGQIKLQCTNNIIDQSLRNKTVRITSGEDGKGKVNGITYSIWESKKGDVEELKINAYATVEEISGGSRTPAPPAQEKRATGAPGANKGVSRTYTSDEILWAVNYTHKSCADLVDGRMGDETEPEVRQAFINSMFIESCKQGVPFLVLSERDNAPKPAGKSTPEPESDNDAQDQVQEQDTAAPKKIVKKIVKKAARPDWSQTTIPDSDRIPEEYRGKKFAEVIPLEGGRDFLREYCIKFNATGFTTDFQKELKQFCLDFHLVKISDEDPDQVEPNE